MPIRLCPIVNCCKQCGARITEIRSTTCECLSKTCERRLSPTQNTRNTSLQSPGWDTDSMAPPSPYKIFMPFPLLLYDFSPKIELDSSKWVFLTSLGFARRNHFQRHRYQPLQLRHLDRTENWRLLFFSLLQRQPSTPLKGLLPSSPA